jgi:signal transduction histidine kinase
MAEGVAHQIRNRLNHFSLATRQMQLEISYFQNDYAELVAQNPVLRETFESLNEIGESLIDNVKRTDAVIQGILNFARGEEKESYYSNLLFHEVVEGALDLARIKHDVESIPVKIEYHKTDYVYGIMTQMVECIYNIIDNCIESIEEKTKYRLGEEEKKSFTPQIVVVLTQSEDWSLIQISDNGVGIREEDRKKIFAPYFTTKSSYKTKHGSGIGLYVVHRMIEEVHGGKIWFDSEYMKGATFYIKLPRKKHIRPAAEMRRPG